MIEQAKSPSVPSPLIRFILVAEVLVYVAGLMVFIWFFSPTENREFRWWYVLVGLVAAGYPIAANLLHGDRPRDSGFRLDNLGKSARETAVVTAVMATVVVAVGLVVGGFHWVHWKRFWELLGTYVAWGIAQQYLIESFSLRRLLQARLPRPAAILLAAGLFAFVHSPNWVLVGATFTAGICWCVLFLRAPNLYTLGAAHGILAILLYHAWPVRWLANLTIGPLFIKKMADIAQAMGM